MTHSNAFKPSALRFVREIPTRWVERRAKFFFKEVNEPASDGGEELLSVSHITGVTRRSEKTVTMIMAETTEGYKICRPGDLAINTLWAWMGALGVSREHGVVSPAYGVYRQREPEAFRDKYVNLLLRTPMLVAEYNTRSRGVQDSRLRLYPESFLDIPLPCPSLDDQDSIVRFLEEKGRDIDRYLATKRRMIDVLDESKCVAIRDMIRSGCGTGRKTRDSGVEWIDHAPTHWVTAPLKHRYQVDLGKMLDSGRVTGEYPVPYLRNVDVRWGAIRIDDLPTMDIHPSERERYTLKTGDLLLCEGRHLGRAAFWRDELPLCGYQKALHRVRARLPKLDNPKFFYYTTFYCSLTGAFHADGQENTIPHLTKEQLSNYRFLFPPREEQDEIVARLDDRFRAVDSLIATVEREVTVMEEYRTRLIADAVTGQIDVRGLG